MTTEKTDKPKNLEGQRFGCEGSEMVIWGNVNEGRFGKFVSFLVSKARKNRDTGQWEKTYYFNAEDLRTLQEHIIPAAIAWGKEKTKQIEAEKASPEKQEKGTKGVFGDDDIRF